MGRINNLDVGKYILELLYIQDLEKIEPLMCDICIYMCLYDPCMNDIITDICIYMCVYAPCMNNIITDIQYQVISSLFSIEILT